MPKSIWRQLGWCAALVLAILLGNPDLTAQAASTTWTVTSLSDDVTDGDSRYTDATLAVCPHRLLSWQRIVYG